MVRRFLVVCIVFEDLVVILWLSEELWPALNFGIAAIACSFRFL